MVEFDLDKVNELLQQLEGLPKVREITDLIKRLEKEKEKLVAVDTTGAPTPVKEAVTTQPNISRSNKLQRYWRYIKLIRDNFPNLSVAEIRKQFSVRREGLKVEIPDAVWQNPSP